jgi:hypothetical protein
LSRSRRLHQELTHLLRRDLPLGALLAIASIRSGSRFECLRRDGALLARLQQSAMTFWPVEALAPPSFFTTMCGIWSMRS